VVQGIVRDLGGTIHLSTEPGKGAKFEMPLPCAETGAEETRFVTSQDDSAQTSPGATVLVVEDEDALRLPLAKMLRMKGFEILEASNGSAAIDLLRTGSANIDVMVLDMTIPGPSSNDVMAVAGEVRPGLKVVLTSAHDERMVRNIVAAPQECGFLRKPFQVGDLLQALRNALS
jgi:DNA-binding NtrC family response regulator